MNELVNRLSALIAGGDAAGTQQLVASLEKSDPAAHEVAQAILALASREPDSVVAHARRAHELAPSQPQPLTYLAAGLLLKGLVDEAEKAARQAVERGGGARARIALANIYTARGQHAQAVKLLDEVVAAEPENVDALNALAIAHFRGRDWGFATTYFARAFDLKPGDRTAIDGMIEMQAEVGKYLGALAALNVARSLEEDSEGDDHQKKMVLLDTVMLLVARTANQQFPDVIDEEVDEAVTAVMGSCKPRPNRVRLAVVRALVDADRLDKAKRMLDVIEKEPLDAADRGVLLYLQGTVAGKGGDAETAQAKWRASLASDPTRTDAATNLVSALLERGTPEAFDEIGRLLATIPDEVKGTTPQLVFNEGVWHLRNERRDEARAAFERVVRITQGGHGEIGAFALQALDRLRTN